MKDKEMIEEMAKDIQNAVNGCVKYWAEVIAKYLTEQDYRKLPKDSVVLTKDELEDKVIITKKEYDKLKYTFNCGYPVYKQGLEEGSKETVEKILNYIADLRIITNGKVCAYDLVNQLEELAKQFGVEIKE